MPLFKQTASILLSSLLSAKAFSPSPTFQISSPQEVLQVQGLPRRRTSNSNNPYKTTSCLYSESSKTENAIISPFDNEQNEPVSDEILELTWENVEKVLDEMRPYLIQDGGNVSIAEIDGPVVRLQLEGACGTCPSSTQTMKMGLERGLREKIPEIQEVIQAMPEGPPLSTEQVEVILDGVRPFLKVAGGNIKCEGILGEKSLQPCIQLRMEGSSASLNSVKLEISQRLQRHFMLAGLQIEFLK